MRYDINQMHRKMSQGYEYVTRVDAFEKAVAELAESPVIGIDTEADSLHRYRERVSLIQIQGEERTWIIDPLAVPDVSPLGPLFSSPTILKVLHGADYDVVTLNRDYGFVIEPLFDTCLAARVAGVDRFGLGDLLQRFFGVSVSKKFQKADWSRRPLPPELLEYAARDVHYLPELYAILSAAVKERGRAAMVEEECRVLSRRVWTGRPFEPDDFLRISGVAQLEPQAKRVARALAVARDRVARERDRPPFKVLGNEDLVRLAIAAPQNPRDLAGLFPRASHPVRREQNYWLAAVQEGIRDTSPLPERGPRRPTMTPDQERLFQHLRTWRNERAQSEAIEPAMVLSSEELKALVRAWPRDLESLESVPFLRTWQKRKYGADLLSLLNTPVASRGRS